MLRILFGMTVAENGFATMFQVGRVLYYVGSMVGPRLHSVHIYYSAAIVHYGAPCSAVWAGPGPGRGDEVQRDELADGRGPEPSRDHHGRRPRDVRCPLLDSITMRLICYSVYSVKIVLIYVKVVYCVRFCASLPALRAFLGGLGSC